KNHSTGAAATSRLSGLALFRTRRRTTRSQRVQIATPRKAPSRANPTRPPLTSTALTRVSFPASLAKRAEGREPIRRASARQKNPLRSKHAINSLRTQKTYPDGQRANSGRNLG